jgi:hypothetical protein
MVNAVLGIMILDYAKLYGSENPDHDQEEN